VGVAESVRRPGARRGRCPDVSPSFDGGQHPEAEIEVRRAVVVSDHVAPRLDVRTFATEAIEAVRSVTAALVEIT